MRILIVSKHFPNDLHTNVHGVYKRFQMFVDAIKDIAQIDVLFYVPTDLDVAPSSVFQFERSLSKHLNATIRLFLCQRFDYRNSIPKWRLYGAGTFTFFCQPGYIGAAGIKQVQALEACLGYNPNAILVHRLGAMCPLLLTHRALPPVFLDLDDIEHVAFRRGIRNLRKPHARILSYILLPALFSGEYRAIRLAHRTFVCSDVDRLYLRNRWRLKGVVTVPNAVTIPELQPSASELSLLFIGSYFHKPNIDAAEFLIRQIWPRVYQAIPGATLIIAGTPPERIPGYCLDTPGVSFTGFVEDLDSLYRQSRVVCAPILSGSGTRVKIIEAAAYGKPIVSTRIGAEGILMRDGYEIFLRDNPISFAEACLSLLNDHALCDRLGSAARAAVLKQYDQLKVKRLIQRYVKNQKHGRTNLNLA